ncbi:MAG TPA: hypothetical protein ENM97_02820 [Moorella mulderi]|nr:hypothetical protein [Moorella mulderi]
MWENFKRDWPYKLLSLAIAMGLWLYVAYAQNPLGERIFRIPIEVENLSEGLVMAEKPGEVQIRVEGPKELLGALQSRDFRAVINLQGAQVGDNTFPVRVEAPEGVRVISINPPQVAVRVERVEEIQMPVEVSLIGTPASGYRLLVPFLKPSQVLVKGPGGALKNITRVYVEAKIDQATGNFSAQLPVRVAGREGYGADLVSVYPSAVEVFIPIVRDMPSKVIIIKPQIVGQPAPGYAVLRVVVHPSTVEVFAPYEVLAPIDFIPTSPISIEGASKTVIQESSLEIPPGLQVSEFPRPKVVVEIGKK